MKYIFDYFYKNPWYILLLGLIFIIISPALLSYFATCSFFDLSFASKANIGQTIGGITAPIVSFVGAILVYFAFLAQIDANKMNDRENIKESARKECDEIRELIKEVTTKVQIDISVDETSRISKELNESLITNKEALHFLTSVAYILSTVDFTANKIRDFSLSMEVDLKNYKGFARTRFMQFYSYTFENQILILKRSPKIKNEMQMGEDRIYDKLKKREYDDVSKLYAIIALKILNIEQTISPYLKGETNIFWIDDFNEYKKIITR